MSNNNAPPIEVVAPDELSVATDQALAKVAASLADLGGALAKERNHNRRKFVDVKSEVEVAKAINNVKIVRQLNDANSLLKIETKRVETLTAELAKGTSTNPTLNQQRHQFTSILS
ncbi:hypothetical protein HDU76_006914 [Blyttiomyces sp. JEL0837]|nr:hypothetical protein HDU76_006914 [Blyttiomyces sp. JEL0837]